GDAELVLLQAELDGAGALVGELGDALNGAGEIFRADDDELVVVARQNGFVVGELAGELARGEDALADAEEELVLIVGELDLLGVGARQQRLQFSERLARDEGLLLAARDGA